MSKLRERIQELESEIEASYAKLASVADNMRSDRITHCESIGAKNARIAALEVEMAKRKDAPPLPDDVRAIVDQLRRSHITSGQTHRLIAFIDATFPKPVPQWEQDARDLEAVAKTGVRFEEAGKTCRDIAARMRKREVERGG